MASSYPTLPAAEFKQLDYIPTPVFVLEVGSDGVPRYVAMNTLACSLAGKPQSYFLNRTAQDVYPQGFGRTAHARHCEVARNGTPLTFDLDLPLSVGTRSVRTTLVPQRDSDNGRYLLYGSLTDITVEQAAREKQVSFDTLTKEMEQFVALAAHDLRAPMRNMAMLAELLKEDFVDHGDGKAELLNMMEDVARKSMTLISDVLNHARTVEVKTTRTTFNISELSQDICDVLDPQGLHNFACTSAIVSTDRTAMQIAFRNIIDNALKFGGTGPLNISIKVAPGAQGMLECVMSDNGNGFSESAIRYLNGGAFRIDSGYGLLGVRRLVEARGGAIIASNSEEGDGAVISFSLPGDWLGETNPLGGILEQWAQNGHADRAVLRRRA